MTADPDGGTRKIGKWVRDKKSGDLGVVKDEYLSWVNVRFSHIKADYHVNLLDPALPREGEWWEQVACTGMDRHGPVGIGDVGKIRWDRYDGLVCKERALCGCLVPVNYGMGNEAEQRYDHSDDAFTYATATNVSVASPEERVTIFDPCRSCGHFTNTWVHAHKCYGHNVRLQTIDCECGLTGEMLDDPRKPLARCTNVVTAGAAVIGTNAKVTSYHFKMEKPPVVSVPLGRDLVPYVVKDGPSGPVIVFGTDPPQQWDGKKLSPVEQCGYAKPKYTEIDIPAPDPMFVEMLGRDEKTARTTSLLDFARIDQVKREEYQTRLDTAIRTLKRSLRSWPECAYGGTINSAVIGMQDLKSSLYLICDKCGKGWGG